MAADDRVSFFVHALALSAAQAAGHVTESPSETQALHQLHDLFAGCDALRIADALGGRDRDMLLLPGSTGKLTLYAVVRMQSDRDMAVFERTRRVRAWGPHPLRGKVRHRTAAVHVLRSWPRGRLPDEAAETVRHALEAEPEEDVRLGLTA
ncbi:hypothetical protein JOF56_004102 [Kibdelosporangium banguiense]|uniref:Uncharacterized protein n=1 Tax=Kibdelosporangium banguiense TaxID=1365924 RepID=A0ABS4TH11_9PSEU|nr:hypothetical protein [Kibdelosporangium banguiense]MBP2323717.1 hypothetical protein [Kibdelosporangium banguiense]